MFQVTLLALGALIGAASGAPSFHAYFANWAQYHSGKYKHTPSSLAPVVTKLDGIIYSFIYFCPPAGTSPMPYWAVAPYGDCTDATEFQLTSVEAKDSEFIPQIVGYKEQNPQLKVTVSIGGWNFPSGYFSKMVSSSDSRSKFIASAKAFAQKYNLDGVDIDWEFPGSPPRSDPVKISCETFRSVADAGGSSSDGENFVTFLSELKTGLGGLSVSVASQAAQKNWEAMSVVKASPFVDMWHVMTYDYSVSDIDSAATTAPNAPLYSPPTSEGPQWSVNYTVQGYLAAGVPKEKIMVGIPYYGHTWYTPGLSGSAWQQFGIKSQVQGECCGPFAKTYGAKPGQGCSLCGTMMYSEILAAAPTYFYDNVTQSAIGYVESSGHDGGYTEGGTWISFPDPTSVRAISKYAMAEGVAGVFAFDTSMDTVSSGGTFTFELTNLISDTLTGGSGDINPCQPGSDGSCPSTVCASCCSSSIASAEQCQSCLSSSCSGPAPPSNTCTGKAGGYYCMASDKTHYISCPEGIEQSCAPGTCCKQSSEGIISCGFC